MSISVSREAAEAAEHALEDGAWRLPVAPEVEIDGQDAGAPQGEATTALWLGRIGLVSLIGLGAWRFARGGSWPWAVAVAATRRSVWMARTCATCPASVPNSALFLCSVERVSRSS